MIHKAEVQSILETLYRRDYKKDIMLYWTNGLTEDDYVRQCRTNPSYKSITNDRREIEWNKKFIEGELNVI